MIPENQDPIGLALADYYKTGVEAEIIVNSTISEEDVLPASRFFRTRESMSRIDLLAIEKCGVQVLDIGAGAGSHALILQEMGRNVTALEISPIACELMRERGVKDVICDDFKDFRGSKYDSLFFMMNGIGICGDLIGVQVFLEKAKIWLKGGGNILLDSSDLIYMFEDEDGSCLIDINSDSYYGELEYQLSYKSAVTKTFRWLFIDFSSLHELALKAGYTCELLYEDDHFQYLAELKLST